MLYVRRMGKTFFTRNAAAVRAGDEFRKNRTDIQILRAVAVLAVIVFHAGFPLRAGYLGVDVFFVVSGYVIAALLIGEFRETGRLQLGRFYLRRIRRLVPALAVMVTVVAFFSMLVYPVYSTFRPGFISGISGLFFTANVAIDRLNWDYFAPLSEWNPFLHLWSLGVEEQFYLFFPGFLILTLFVAKKRPHYGGRIILAAIVVSFVLAVFGASDLKIQLPFGQSFVGFYSPVTRAWEFLIGVLIALLPARRVTSFASKVILVLASAGLVGSFVFLEADIEDRVFPLVILVLSTAGIVWVGRVKPHADQPMNILAKFMARIGDVSYSLYLWHWPLMVLLSYVLPASQWAKPLSLFISVPLAIVFYHLIENRIWR